MKLDQRLVSLIQLLEDPDPSISAMVIQEIIKYGPEVLPRLEFANRHIKDRALKEQLGMVIQQFRFEALTNSFKIWTEEADPSMIQGIFLLSKWLDNQIDWEEFNELFNEVKLNIWMSMDHNMTSFEKIYMINSIFYHHYHFKIFETGGLLSYNPYHLLTESIGNKFSIGLLYIAICEALEIPVYALDIPELLILGYLQEKTLQTEQGENIFYVVHYIDPESGWIHGKEEVELHLQEYLNNTATTTVRPLSNKDLIKFLLQQIAQDQSLKTDPSFDEIKDQLKHWISLLN